VIEKKIVKTHKIPQTKLKPAEPTKYLFVGYI